LLISARALALINQARNDAFSNRLGRNRALLSLEALFLPSDDDDDSNLTPLLGSCFQLGDAMFVELPRVRLDGGARVFRQHWGYETRPLAPPPPLIEEDEAAVEPETVSLREANTASPIGEYLPNRFCRDIAMHFHFRITPAGMFAASALRDRERLDGLRPIMDGVIALYVISLSLESEASDTSSERSSRRNIKAESR